MVIGLCGCGAEPRFDGFSEETVKASTQKMVARMNEDQKKQFAGDLATCVMIEGMRTAFPAAFKGQGRQLTNTADVYRSIDGLTAGEIHEKTEKMRAEMKAQREGQSKGAISNSGP